MKAFKIKQVKPDSLLSCMSKTSGSAMQIKAAARTFYFRGRSLINNLNLCILLRHVHNITTITYFLKSQNTHES